MKSNKRQKVSVSGFDYQDYFNEMFEKTTVLMWNTRHEPYTFAYYLNKLYNIRLDRKKSISITKPNTGGEKMLCSVYQYQSAVEHIAYILIDSSEGTRGEDKKGMLFDKTLLLTGAESDRIGQNIYEEMLQGSGASKACQLDERDETMREFIDTGILECVLFDFSNPEEMETTYFAGGQGNKSMEAKRQRFLNEQRSLVSEMMIALDDLLPNFDEDEDCQTLKAMKTNFESNEEKN